MDIKIVYISDNIHLINTSKEHKNYDKPYPNNTLSSEFDITEQIYQTNKTYRIDASFHHVYGHQDTKSRGEMSMEAKLNVEADRLAGEYQDEFGVYSPITHMYPTSPAILKINGTIITSTIRHHLIKAYAEPRYMRYLQKKNKWNRKTVQLIAWNCLNLGLRHLSREVVLVKICNDLLPTATTLQKMEVAST